MKQNVKRRAHSGKGMGLKRERAKARKERDSHFLLFSPFPPVLSLSKGFSRL